MGDYDRGLALLRQLGGTDEPAVLELFHRIGADDFGTEAVAYVYGGVYQRAGLSLAQRQLITVAALAAVGFAEAQLRFHLAAARNVGCSGRQLREALDLVGSTVDVAGDEVSGLGDQDRHLVALAAYTALGGVAPELDDHVRAVGDDRAAVEAVLHLSVYVGFPAALNALTRIASASA
ncbi:carboxymuconolactone decarboxylase family protein [Allokutzneria sp. NRRL B-24872]|uniref:carboxymuconolactone decarboxylase family protein n=1 Tax=Allokutzneria sp. NRRL B-24872 TaxID=1137961 RepID=UPI000A3AE366|nr:carboxymuconolactone decarboxylase family protein [Allokutzneria sp. NRRL B-24872]